MAVQLARALHELICCELCAVRPSCLRVSLAVGLVEASMTCKTNYDSAGCWVADPGELLLLAETLNDRVLKLQHKFEQFAASIKITAADNPRQIITDAAAAVWKGLKSGFAKDGLHRQSVFTFLETGHADCFGLALCVLCCCRSIATRHPGALLGIHLVVSEDHCWLGFEEGGIQSTAEVAWKDSGPKANHKCGTSVAAEHAWLYLNHHSVHLTDRMTVAAIVQAIQPSIGNDAMQFE